MRTALTHLQLDMPLINFLVEIGVRIVRTVQNSAARLDRKAGYTARFFQKGVRRKIFLHFVPATRKVNLLTKTWLF